MANGSSSNATLILVLGILSLVCCGLLGPVAWIMGNNALRDIDAGIGNPSDRGLVVAGRILGIIATVLMVLVILIYGMIFLLALLGGGVATRWSP
jgi:hypothetical protein